MMTMSFSFWVYICQVQCTSTTLCGLLSSTYAAIQLNSPAGAIDCRFVHARVGLSFGHQDGADGSVLADNLFELKNGCICCTVKDDLVTTLETLLERRNKFDYVIIETTGLANPVRAHPFMLCLYFYIVLSLSLCRCASCVC